MHVKERDPGDRKRLGRMIKSERDAMQRDRLRCVALAIDGRETLEIAASLGRSRRFVQRWVYAYRDRGLGAVHGDTAPGSARRMTPEQEARFIERVRRGRDARGRRVFAAGHAHASDPRARVRRAVLAQRRLRHPASQP